MGSPNYSLDVKQVIAGYSKKCNTWYRLEPPIHNAPTEYDQIYRLLTGYNGGCQRVLSYISNNNTKISNNGAKTSNPPNNEKLP